MTVRIDLILIPSLYRGFANFGPRISVVDTEGKTPQDCLGPDTHIYIHQLFPRAMSHRTVEREFLAGTHGMRRSIYPLVLTPP